MRERDYYVYFIIVKGSREEADEAIRSRGFLITASTDLRWTEDRRRNQHGELHSTADLSFALNRWFIEDAHSDPFPAGSLLFWRPKVIRGRVNV